MPRVIEEKLCSGLQLCCDTGGPGHHPELLSAQESLHPSHGVPAPPPPATAMPILAAAVWASQMISCLAHNAVGGQSDPTAQHRRGDSPA